MAGINGYPGLIKNIVRGDTRDFVVVVKDSNLNPIDITGGKFYLTFSPRLDPETAPTLEIIIDPPTHPQLGKTVGVITDTQTYALPKGVFYYSIRYVRNDGATYIIDMGKIKVLESISSRIE